MITGVLQNDELYTFDSSEQKIRTLFYPYPTTQETLKYIIDESELDLLFVIHKPALQRGWVPSYEGYKFFKSVRKNGMLQAFRMYKTEGERRERRTIKVIFLAIARQWALFDEKDGLALLKSVVKLQECGVTFELSPGGTGRGLIKKYTQERYRKECDLSQLPPRVLAVPPSYKLELSESEREKKYLHIFDKSAMFLRGCTGVELGSGSPTFVTPQVARNIFSERVPGLWSVKVEGEDMQLWTPYVHYLQRKGVQVEMGCAYVWYEHHAILRQWAEALWNIRVKVGDDKRARMINKLFYTQSLGWLRMGEEYKRDSHDELFRPDWHELVKEHAFCLIRFTIDKIERERGVRVVWCNVDEVGVLSDKPNPYEAFPGLATVNPTQGGFTVKYSVRMTEDIRALFSTEVPFIDCQRALYVAGKEGL